MAATRTDIRIYVSLTSDSVCSDTRFQGSTDSPRPASGITPESRAEDGDGSGGGGGVRRDGDNRCRLSARESSEYRGTGRLAGIRHSASGYHSKRFATVPKSSVT